MDGCNLCGNPMPKGEETFKYHGYSSSCPRVCECGDYEHQHRDGHGKCKITASNCECLIFREVKISKPLTYKRKYI